MTREEAAEIMLEGVWLKCERCGGRGYEKSINDCCSGCGRGGFIRHPRATEACLALGIPVPEKPPSLNELIERSAEEFKKSLNSPSPIHRMFIKTGVDDDKGTGS